MALSQAQLQTLKTDIAADPVFSTLPLTTANAITIATAYNSTASPNFTVWKTLVILNAVGDAINSVELAGLTQLNVTRLSFLFQSAPDGINPSKADRRAGFDDIFSGAGGATTRASLLALWKRLATRGEKLYATGTGSDASPATLVFEGGITPQEVINAIQLP